MLKIIFAIFIFCFSVCCQSLDIVIEASMSSQADTNNKTLFISIAETLVTTFEQSRVCIKEKRIDKISLPIKKRFDILDSLDAQVYISLSNDIKNDSNLNNLIKVRERLHKLRKSEMKSKLDSLFINEYFQKTGENLQENEKIFYPVTTMLKNENRLTHMVIDLKPVLDSMKDNKNPNMINIVADALYNCIMHYSGFIRY